MGLWPNLVRTGITQSGDSGVGDRRLRSGLVRRLRSGITQISGISGPRGTVVPPKSFGEHPSHTREKSMRHSEEVARVSALKSPKYPETPPQIDKSQKDLRLLFSEPLLTTHTKPENLSL